MPFRHDGQCFSLKFWRLPINNDAASLGVFKALKHQQPPHRFCYLFFEVLPFTTLASR